MSEDLKEYFHKEIDKLFIRNGMDGSFLHRFFTDCFEDNKLHQFYIDDRVPFKGKRKLYQLIEELQKAMEEESI